MCKKTNNYRKIRQCSYASSSVITFEILYFVYSYLSSVKFLTFYYDQLLKKNIKQRRTLRPTLLRCECMKRRLSKVIQKSNHVKKIVTSDIVNVCEYRVKNTQITQVGLKGWLPKTNFLDRSYNNPKKLPNINVIDNCSKGPRRYQK